jgi:hypothetical protein
MTTKLNLTIEQGKTFQRLLRWETTPLVYKAVSAITQAAPARVTATAHGVPPGWNVALTGVRGMTEINASQIPPKDADMHQATVIDANTLELNTVSAADFSAYAGAAISATTRRTISRATPRACRSRTRSAARCSCRSPPKQRHHRRFNQSHDPARDRCRRFRRVHVEEGRVRPRAREPNRRRRRAVLRHRRADP